MRSRTTSGVRLDHYYWMVSKTILIHQDPITGLIATNEDGHAWVRDNVYSILAVWGLTLAYKKHAEMDEDKVKAFELEHSVVKLMRSLLTCMMSQSRKVERFKLTMSLSDAIHAKYDSSLLSTVVGDYEWGHLQIDATSLYLLMLAQMTASGLVLIYSLDEVAFIQNLIFYIENAYRTPDFGIWERGEKTNHGLPELNASSIGMAKAALEAVNELDLFGSLGGPESVVHVMPDEVMNCNAVLQSMLPRESSSKEVDAALLLVIGYPAFAVNDEEISRMTQRTIIEKLEGDYGCIRFMRDGHKTCKEDSSRLYYQPWELKEFENIECEWPLFWTIMVLNGLFKQNMEEANRYQELLTEILVRDEDGIVMVPQYYYVRESMVAAEQAEPHSTKRLPGGDMPYLWAQSFYILSLLLYDNLIEPGEIDPLNRRFSAGSNSDLIVQTVCVAEDQMMKRKLGEQGIHVQTQSELSPILMHPSSVLSELYSHLGINDKLKLSGRPLHQIGILGTCRIYNIKGKLFCFTPKIFDQQRFYLALDTKLIVDTFKNELAFVKNNWTSLGRPTIIVPLSRAVLDGTDGLSPVFLSLLKKMNSGYTSGVRIARGSW